MRRGTRQLYGDGNVLIGDRVWVMRAYHFSKLYSEDMCLSMYMNLYLKKKKLKKKNRNHSMVVQRVHGSLMK